MKRIPTPSCLISCLLLAGVTTATATAENAAIDALGLLPGSIRSLAHGLSADGGTVVGTSIPVGSEGRAFVWRASGGMSALPTLLGDDHDSDALAVSADGSVIVGYADDGGTFDLSPTQAPLRWDHGKLSQLPRPGPATAWAQAISADGTTIVGGLGSDRILRWRNGLVETLASSPSLVAFNLSLSATGREGAAIDVIHNQIYHWSDSVGIVTARTSPSVYDGQGFYPQTAAITADGQRFFAAGGRLFVATNTLSLWQGFGDGLPVPAAPAVNRYGYVSHLATIASGNLLAVQMAARATNVEDVALIVPPYGPLPLGHLLRAQGADTSHWSAITNLSAISGDGRWVAGAGLTVRPVGGNSHLEAFRAKLVLHGEADPVLKVATIQRPLETPFTELRWPVTDLLVAVESVPALLPGVPWVAEAGLPRIEGNEIVLRLYRSELPRLYRLRRLD